MTLLAPQRMICGGSESTSAKDQEDGRARPKIVTGNAPVNEYIGLKLAEKGRSRRRNPKASRLQRLTNTEKSKNHKAEERNTAKGTYEDDPRIRTNREGHRIDKKERE